MNGLVDIIFDVCMEVWVMWDVICGGLVIVLNEFVMSLKVGIWFFEKKLLVCEKVLVVCEIFGFDFLYFVNEGKLVIVVLLDKVDIVLKVM